jgi:hypothetical protein
LTDRDERALLRGSVSDPKLTAPEICFSVGGSAIGVSVRTVKRCLIRCERFSFRPRKDHHTMLLREEDVFSGANNFMTGMKRSDNKYALLVRLK